MLEIGGRSRKNDIQFYLPMRKGTDMERRRIATLLASFGISAHDSSRHTDLSHMLHEQITPNASLGIAANESPITSLSHDCQTT
jgi:hypothetical protein